MFDSDIYRDMAERSGGEIYIGVVGPVRTGKSTLIKRFMTELVLPHADDDRLAEMVDELPQSAAGRTVMTTEPKFIPAKAVKVKVDNAEARVRLIDCVGFAVEGAAGFEENGSPRLVNTMWSDKPIPFTEAAAIGTQKVICDHSTIGLCVTCDGSVTDLPRDSYIPAEERTVAELKKIGKPFVVVLNCADPTGRSAQQLKEELQQKYSCPVVAVNCEKASVDELSSVLRAVLFEFPVTSVDVKIPDWIRVMPADSTAISELLNRVRSVCEKVGVMRECSLFDGAFAGSSIWRDDVSVNLSLATGKATVEVGLQDGVLFNMLTEISGEEICDEGGLMQYVAAASQAKRNYDKVKDAFERAKMTGYGIVCPDDGDLSLDKPKVVKQGSNVGIKLRATAPSYHVVKVDVSGEVSPIMGNASQSEDMVNGIMNGFETDPQATWNTALFGKSLRSMVKEGLDGKVNAMQDDTRNKMRRTITRIVNEGKGGVICILL
ncbi:MAG: stage IV sporulation protein A [Clostridia bacterium]|nr:stage IV sporulation protein A [Clostridia bacterium]